MMDLMYTPLESVFYSTLQREGRTVAVYTSGASFQAFMRRNDDGNNFEDRITLYYPVDAPIVQGSIIGFGSRLYILVNRETEENNCYYKSSGLACNGMIALNDGTLAGIPCYAYNMDGALAEEGEVMSVIDGKMEFITECSSLSRQLCIGQTFNEFGRTFKIDNLYYKDGILHVVAKVHANEKPVQNLKIVIDGAKGSYAVGDTAALKAALYLNTACTTGTVKWQSSDNTVATINGDGKVTFLGEGSVVFTAYWVEKDYTQDTGSIYIGSNPSMEQYMVEISGKDTIHIGYARTYTSHLYDPGNKEVDGMWIFEVDFKNKELLRTTQNGNEFVIEVLHDESILGERLILTATEKSTNIKATKIITIKSLF